MTATPAVLGDFEQLVLLALLQAGDQAYGIRIADEIAARTGRDISVGAVYTTLDRLEAKGLVTCSVGEPLPERGGRRRKYFRLERTGRRALQQSIGALKRMTQGLAAELEL